jgi:CheY-like chemotaxis protein
MAKPRLLFVDDDPAILQILKRVLRSDGHRWEATFVLGGLAGVAAIEQSSFDVVISDLEMPVVNGRGVLATARQRSVAVRILLTGSGVTSADDAHAVLAKPCDARALRGLIERLLDARNLPASAP